MSLSSLKPGTRAQIIDIHTASQDHSLAIRMMEMGMTVGTELEIVHEAPFGGAIAVRCRGALIALRNQDAECIEVKVL
ncbi:MAG: FeoA family protein [Bdellovibrionota bacterium]